MSKGGLDLASLPNGARVGTSSLRRAVCLRTARPDLAIEPLRGNVDTRLRKLAQERYGRAHVVRPEVVIEVADGGPGFDAGMSDRGLEPFYSTKAGHRGLGLNIAQRIGKRYGGSFEIRALSPGACVSLRFAPSGGEHDDSSLGR